MRINHRILFLLSILFICQNSLTAFTNSFSIVQDTIPTSNMEYKGNRIMVKSIKVIKKRGNKIKIEYNLVNSGRNKIKLGKNKNIPNDLIIVFDKSLDENNLLASKSAIIENLKTQSISIRPGQLIMGNKLKFEYSDLPPSDRIADSTPDKTTNTPKEKETPQKEKETQKEMPNTENVVAVESEKTEIENKNTETESTHPVDNTNTKFDEAVKDIVVAVPLPEDLNKEAEPDTTTLGETILTQENQVPHQGEMLETETILEVVKTENEKTTEETIAESVQEIPKENFPKEKKESTPQAENKQETLPQEQQCADLVMQNVHIVKKKKRYVTIECTITNVGNTPVALFEKTKKDANYIAIQAHLTRSNKLTKGAIFVKGFFIKKALKDKQGILAPNENITQKIKIETSKLTKFTPVLCISLDPFHVVKECNELNNLAFINIAEQDAPSSTNPTPVLKKSNSNEKGEWSEAMNNGQLKIEN